MKKTISIVDSDEMWAFVNAQQNFSRSIQLLIKQSILRYGEDVDISQLFEKISYQALADTDKPVTLGAAPKPKKPATHSGFSSAPATKARKPSQTYSIPEGY